MSGADEAWQELRRRARWAVEHVGGARTLLLELESIRWQSAAGTAFHGQLRRVAFQLAVLSAGLQALESEVGVAASQAAAAREELLAALLRASIGTLP
ncbi:hypothetical protein ACQ3I4_08220 [Zafaria sp. Z1313]|uniref:hypothetical protein n=1 Tax=Zafaria sp. Z1313 TaxID=3423202 RepID=UPI003D3020C7